MTCESVAATIERVFTGRCTPDEWTRLFAHLRECPRCRARYDERRAALLVAQDHPADDKYLSSRELDLATDIGLARVRAAERARRLRAMAVGTALAASLLGAALFARTRDPHRVDPTSEFQARGGDDAFGAQILCFSKDDLDNPSTLKRSGRCPPGSLLKVQASSLDSHVSHVVAVVLCDGLEKLGVFRAKLDVPQSATLHGHVDLGTRKEIAVVVVFSQQEQSERTLDAAVQGAAQAKEGLSTLRSLALDGVSAQKVYHVKAGDP